MRATRCPFCGSTDVVEIATLDEKDCGCLDCDGRWRNGGKNSDRPIRVPGWMIGRA